MDFIRLCIHNRYVDDEFINKFYIRFEKWCKSKEDEIRAKCASVLRELRTIDLIKVKADNLCIEMIEREKNASVKRILELKPMNKNYSQNRLDNFRFDEEFLISREDVIVKLRNELENNYLVAIVGFGGIGKTTTAKIFTEEIKNNYRMTWIINAESESSLDAFFF